MRLNVPVVTGNVCAGKSFCVSIFAEWGYHAIDADHVVALGMRPGGFLYKHYLAVLGDAVLADNGHIDRHLVRQRIFSQPKLKAALERSVHPLVFSEIERRLAAFPPGERVLVAIPLYFEAVLRVDAFPVILVYCRDTLRMERLMRRQGVDRSLAQRIMRSQMPQQLKMWAVDVVIDNSFEKDHTKAQAALVHQAISQWNM